MPSKLLRRMRELADVPTDSALIKHIFFSKLPPQVKEILAPMVEKSSTDVIASSGDRVMDFTKGPITASIPQSQGEVLTCFAAGNTNQEATYVAILKDMERLTKEIKRISRGKVTIAETSMQKSFAIPTPPAPLIQARTVLLSQSLWRGGREMQNALFVCKTGKLKSGELSTAHSPQDLQNNRAYFITDFRSQAHCLVDTGAAWPLKLITEKPPVSPITLQVVNHSPIPTYGQISRYWNYGETLHGSLL